MDSADIRAVGFPRDLDHHPLLAWMGDDWVTYVVLSVLTEMGRLDSGVQLAAVRCVEPPELETRAQRSGAVTGVMLRIAVELRLADGAVLPGTATFTGPDPRTAELEVATPAERQRAVLRAARALVARPTDEHSSGDVLSEIDGHLSELRYGPVRTSRIAATFAPTGPMQELARSSGWGDELDELAARLDGIVSVACEVWSCPICDVDAGTIELHETGELRSESFTGVLTRRLTEPAAVDRLWDALMTGGADAVHAVSPVLVPFWCPECRSVYCGEHWTRSDDATRGRCPHGHVAERGGDQSWI